MKEALRSMTEDMMAMIRRKDFALFNLALSGGETAKHMFSLWVDEYKDKIDWNNIRFFWVDERCVPPTSPDSNYGHANHLLFKPLRIPADHIHQIKGENERGDALFMGRKGILAVVQSNAYVRLHHPRRR